MGQNGRGEAIRQLSSAQAIVRAHKTAYVNNAYLVIAWSGRHCISHRQSFLPSTRRQSNSPTYTNADLDAKSASSMDQIRRWSVNCSLYHRHTDVNIQIRLPTRVIVVDSCLTRPKLYVDRGLTTGHNALYAALSYCWGKSKATVTTTRTLEQHATYVFDLASLPKTLQDAVTVTRALGLRYLWVDALCILQGNDPEARRDWDTESSKMSSVFSNAYVTIIAASSSDCNDGIFRKSSIIPTSKIGTDGFLDRKIWSAHRKLDSDLGLSTQYNVRAWTLQEMVLSPRALFFTPSMKYWKCACGVIGEDCKQARFTAVKSMTKELAQRTGMLWCKNTHVGS